MRWVYPAAMLALIALFVAMLLLSLTV